MKIIKDRFDLAFRRWEIKLPAQDLLARQRGTIVRSGWVIWYLFGQNLKGEYMDYYAAHRMTNDRHVRLYFDGTAERLPTPQELCVVPKDPEKAAKNRAEFYAHNRRIAKLREEKGFIMPKNADPILRINQILEQGLSKDPDGNPQT